MNIENEEHVCRMTEQFRNTGKTFAEFLSEALKDTLVEIYLGDAYEQVSTEQISTPYPAVFCGKIVSAYKECLVINCAYVDKHKKLKSGKFVFINERAIRGLSAIDGSGSPLQSLFWRSSESTNLFEVFGRK